MEHGQCLAMGAQSFACTASLWPYLYSFVWKSGKSGSLASRLSASFSRCLTYLGGISAGLFVCHPVIRVLALKACDLGCNLLIVTLVYAVLSILVAAVYNLCYKRVMKKLLPKQWACCSWVKRKKGLQKKSLFGVIRLGFKIWNIKKCFWNIMCCKSMIYKVNNSKTSHKCGANIWFGGAKMLSLNHIIIHLNNII